MEELEQLKYELNVETALKVEPTTALSTTLQHYAKVRLNEWASLFKVNGRSKMNKEQLAQALVPYMADPNLLCRLFIILSDNEWKFFERLLDNQLVVQENTVSPKDYITLQTWGIIHLFHHEQRIYSVVSEEVFEGWKLVDQRLLKQQRQQYILIHRYICAFANLYGAFKIEQVVEVFNKQQAKQITIKEAAKVLVESMDTNQHYSAIGEYIVHSYFIEQSQEQKLDPNELQLADILMRRSGKPWYTPDAAELLRYSDVYYYEITPQLTALYDYLKMYMIDDEVVLENLLDEMQYRCAMEQPMQEVMHVFLNYDIHFDMHEQLQLVVALVNEVYNNTRIWSNAGYTPRELYELYEQPSSNKQTHGAPNSLLRSTTVQVDKKLKIGRNDPCPCGSGKKYKKCCSA
ncbi:SEC-C metal-binding domain-containing protein [Paenibacillus yanchengensis]|uniref:SEC-C metal-binding domain-containing protein n=1 Tax=Paenibacillus yanchengensis TaxID=2035833 RepID=A0ABW4YH73_9BACL